MIKSKIRVRTIKNGVIPPMGSINFDVMAKEIFESCDLLAHLMTTGSRDVCRIGPSLPG